MQATKQAALESQSELSDAMKKAMPRSFLE
jgi:hypothetical protein